MKKLLIILCTLISVSGCATASKPANILAYSAGGNQAFAKSTIAPCSIARITTSLDIRSDKDFSGDSCKSLKVAEQRLEASYQQAFEIQRERSAQDKAFHGASYAGIVLPFLFFLSCGIKGDDPANVKQLAQSYNELQTVKDLLADKDC